MFEVTGSGATVEISGLTIADGYAAFGGGVYVGAGAALTLRDCAVTDNRTARGADGVPHSSPVRDCGDGGNGGGLFNDGMLEIRSCAIRGNSTGAGGDDYRWDNTYGCSGGWGGGIHKAGVLTMTDSSVTANTNGSGGCSASCWWSGWGGGIFNSKDGDASIGETRVSDNTTGPGRNAAYYQGGSGGHGAESPTRAHLR